jgi:hypothetical protein
MQVQLRGLVARIQGWFDLQEAVGIAVVVEYSLQAEILEFVQPRSGTNTRTSILQPCFLSQHISDGLSWHIHIIDGDSLQPDKDSYSYLASWS